MKRVLTIITLFTAFLTFPVSCVKEVIPEISVPEGSVSVSVKAEASTVSIQVTSNVELTVESSESWLKYTGEGSSSTGSYKFTVEANHSLLARNAKVTFKGKDYPDTKASVTVKQEGATPNMLVYCFTGSSLGLPVLTGGSYLQATIDWGDGNTELWSKSKGHSYLKAGTYTVSISMLDNTGCKLEDLVGIESLDLSKF